MRNLLHLDWGFIDESYKPLIVPKLLNKALISKKYQLLQYNDGQGLKELRVLVSNFLRNEFDVKNISEFNICITNGATAGLDLVARHLLYKKYDSVYFEPIYDTAIESLKINSRHSYGIKLEPFSDCLIPEKAWVALERILSKSSTKLFYIVPNFQNPLGITFQEQERLKILKLCQKYEVFILEDDPYKLYNFTKTALPENLINLDLQKDNTIYINSVSKLIFPGLRIGYVVANENLIKNISEIQKYTTSSANLLMQGLVIEAFKDLEIKKAFEHYYKIVKLKREILYRELNKQGLGTFLDYIVSEGGFYVWCRVKIKSLDTRERLKRALLNGVSYVPGYIYFTKNDENEYLRLAYSQIKIEDIPEAVKRLKDAFQ